jgi:hypothetical protein
MSLPTWQTQGKNHVVVDLSPGSETGLLQGNAPVMHYAVMASSSFSTKAFRADFDIIIPSLPTRRTGNGSEDEVWEELPPLDPAFRKFLFSFWGEPNVAPRAAASASSVMEDIEQLKVLKTAFQHLQQQREPAQAQQMHWRIVMTCDDTASSSYSYGTGPFSYSASSKNSSPASAAASPRWSKSSSRDVEWSLCGTFQERGTLLTESTFAIVFAPLADTSLTSVEFQMRLSEALQRGAVPVIIGSAVFRLVILYYLCACYQLSG